MQRAPLLPLFVVSMFLAAAASCDTAPDPRGDDFSLAETEVAAPEETPPRTGATQEASTSLRAFGSEEELDAFLRERRASGNGYGKGSGAGFGGLGLTGSGFGGGSVGEGTIGLGNTGVIGKGSGAPSGPGPSASDSITNTQEDGVDEGGIVKRHGDHLVVLRRGRLFTVKVGDDALEPVASIDVGSKRKHQAWYDEMLIHRDEVIVVGYSYEYRATEIARFSLSNDGTLQHTVTDYLRSNDYYSSRNYASRLVGDRLVFYMPHRVHGRFDATPSMCSAEKGRCPSSSWRGIVEATEVVRPIDDGPAYVLHTVVSCDLSRGAENMKCTGRGILGASARSFYVSANAVYVWVIDPSWAPPPPWSPAAASMPTDAIVYRLGLSDGTVSAIRGFGAPVDQFSFREDDDGGLDVLVRAKGAGEGMWGAELDVSRDVALFRAPRSSFEPGSCAGADRATYVDLPDPEGPAHAFHNRFVGDTLLYGMGNGWGRPTHGRSTLYVHETTEGDTRVLQLSHPVDRIEAMGEHAVVVGASGEDLGFSMIDLEAGEIASTFDQEGANQGETRSHGFFYRPTSDRAGILGLPIRRGGQSTADQLRRGSAEVLYLAAGDLKFERLGTLGADPNAARNDRCRVSCVDWYGNARPLFIGNRVLALLGYELVEGTLDAGKLRERRRVSMLSSLATRR
jgi:hypothetical protein